MTTSEEQIAELLRALPAVPAGWVQAAKELPAVRLELETIVERIESDERARALAVADLEAMRSRTSAAAGSGTSSENASVTTQTARS